MRITPRQNASNGIVLLECMIYISIFAVILGLTATAFYRFQTQSAHLQRNATDIARTLRAGEQWRAEVRHSSRAAWVEVEGGSILQLNYPTNEIHYAFQEGNVWRRRSAAAAWEPFLSGVTNSVMRQEIRAFAEVWIWEVELSTAQKMVRQRPLFSFIAVLLANARNAE